MPPFIKKVPHHKSPQLTKWRAGQRSRGEGISPDPHILGQSRGNLAYLPAEFIIYISYRVLPRILKIRHDYCTDCINCSVTLTARNAYFFYQGYPGICALN